MEWQPIYTAPKETFIFCYGKGLGNHINGPNMDICILDGELWWNETGTEYFDGAPTHWMPLPKAPE